MLELSFPTLSVEEYLACEQKGDVRHDYVNGYAYALAAGSSRHNRIAGNIYVHLWQLAQGKPCRVFQEGMKLRTSESVFYYPDVMAMCGKPELDPFYETEPCVLVEVLSPSTKGTDLREKLTVYKSLPSVQTYLVELLQNVNAQSTPPLFQSPSTSLLATSRLASAVVS